MVRTAGDRHLLAPWLRVPASKIDRNAGADLLMPNMGIHRTAATKPIYRAGDSALGPRPVMPGRSAVQAGWPACEIQRVSVSCAYVGEH